MSVSLSTQESGLYLGQVKVTNLAPASSSVDISASDSQLLYQSSSSTYGGLTVGQDLTLWDGSLCSGITVPIVGGYIPDVSANVDLGFTFSGTSYYNEDHAYFRPCNSTNLIDGYCAANMTFPAVWQVDLPEAIAVSQFAIQRRPNTERPTAFEFQGSNDGSTWRTLVSCGDVMASTGAPVYVSVSDPLHMKYTSYRLYVTAGFESYWGFYTFQLYSSRLVAPPSNVEFIFTDTSVGAALDPYVKTSILYNGSGATSTFNLPDAVDGQEKVIVSGVNGMNYQDLSNSDILLTQNNSLSNATISLTPDRSLELVYMADLSGWVTTGHVDTSLSSIYL